MKLLSERLNWALKRAGKIPAELARSCQSSDAAVSNWLKDVNGMSAQKARLAGSFLGVNPYWLETGEGDSHTTPGSDTSGIADPNRDALTEQILDAIRRLPADKRQRVADFIAGVEVGMAVPLGDAASNQNESSAAASSTHERAADARSGESDAENVSASKSDLFIPHQPDPSARMYRGTKSASENKGSTKPRRGSSR